MAVDRVTGEVVSAMDAAGIPTILLKGPSIARWLYPEGGRSYCDTDLLVRAGDHARAADLLRAMGFSDRLAGFDPFERRTLPTVATSFVRPANVSGGRGGDVDLHRNLHGLPTGDELLWEVFDGATTVLPVGGRDIRVLDRSGVALHVVVHAVQNGFRLHTDEDLRRAIATLPVQEWEAVAALASRLGIADLLGMGLRHHPAGAAIADRLGLPQSADADSPFHLVLLGGPRGTISLLMFKDTPWRERLRLVRWALLPSRAKVRYVSELPDARGWSLAGAYVRWWQDLARASLPAARFAVRSARDGQSPHVSCERPRRGRQE